MPRPIFIICSGSGAEDRTTGLLSIFNVIDKVMFHRVPLPQPTSPPVVEMRVTAAWSREEQDVDQEYEYEVVVSVPPEGDEHIVGRGRFAFTLPNQRISARVL